MTPTSEESAAANDPHERSSSEAQAEVIYSNTNSSQNHSDIALGNGTTTTPDHHQTNGTNKHHRHNLRRHHHRHNHGNRSRSRLLGLRGVHKKTCPRKHKLVPRRRSPGRCRAAVLKGNLWIRPVAMTAVRGPVPLLSSSATAAVPIFSSPQERQGLDERGLVDLLIPAWLDDDDALLQSSPGVTADSSPRAPAGQARTIFGVSGKPIDSRSVCGQGYFPVMCDLPQSAPSA